MQNKINFSGFINQGVLFSLKDLKEVLSLLSPIHLYNVSSVQAEGVYQVSQEGFIAFYAQYLDMLFGALPMDFPSIQKMFSHALATDTSYFFKMELANQRFLLKPNRSVIQLQPLGLFISSLNQEIHTKTFAKEVQSFGLKWSFATIYEDTSVHKIFELTPQDPEYKKFMELRRYVRHHTQPLTVLKDGEKHTYAFRFSKELKQDVAKMPLFKQHGLEVML